MQLSPTRSVVIISGLLTMLALGGGTLAVAFHNGWLRTGAQAAGDDALAVNPPSAYTAQETKPPTEPAQSSSANPTQDDVALYRQKLEEAYRALDDAYVQIRTLQAPQAQLASARVDDDDDGGRSAGDEDDDKRREHRGRRHESHDD